MPYGVRYLARETLVAMRVRACLLAFSSYDDIFQNKFPDAPDEACAACIGRLVFYRYINPAIM